MNILLVYLPFCTPVSPPYSLTNLHAFLKNNSNANINVLDLNIKFHQYKFPEYQKYFQSTNWEDYEKTANEYHKLTKEVYAQNNAKVVKGDTPEYFDELKKQIEDQKPDVVAFSIVYSSQAFYAHALLKELSIPTVIGGPCVNEKIIALADHYFKNELEFLNFIEPKKHENLNFNFPLDFSLYTLNEYFTPETVIPIKTSTTCYYQQCTFCAHYAKVPYMEYPLDIIEKTIIKSKKKHFFLIDDMIPKKRLKQLAQIFKKYNAIWGCQLRPTKEFTNMEDLPGLTFVLWGFESGSQKTLDKIKKGTIVEDIPNVLKASHEKNVKNVLYTMFGFPGETEEDFMDTINFLKNNQQNIDLISPSTFGLHKGTPIWNNPEEFGITNIVEQPRTVLEPKVNYELKDGLTATETKKLLKKHRSTIDSINKYPKTMNFFREHMFFY
jgi:radical SAM superfamily enzyme YgiQ (UPF0313 family)